MFRSAAGRVAGLIMSASTVVGGALPSAGAAPVSPGVGSAVVVDASGIAPAHGTIERIALPAGPATASPTDSTSATIRPVVPAPSAAVPITPPAPTLHLVRQGDHLWRIAEAALASSWGRPATDQEVDPFWRQVIAANPDVVDPDLIFPGQHVVVPPTPPPPA
jgi:nucleoid-associated protein YgaU